MKIRKQQEVKVRQLEFYKDKSNQRKLSHFLCIYQNKELDVII